MEFKERLKRLREECNLSQQNLANAIYVSRSAIAKWESGLGIPNDSNLEALCEYFNVKEDWLLDRQDLKNCVQIEKRHTAVYITAALATIAALLFIGLCFVDFFGQPIFFSMWYPPTSIFKVFGSTWTGSSREYRFSLPNFILLTVLGMCLAIPVLTVSLNRLKGHHRACVAINLLCVFIAAAVFFVTFCFVVYTYHPMNYWDLFNFLYKLFG